MIANFQAENATLGKDANIVAATKRIDFTRIYRLLGHAQKLLVENSTTGRTGNPHRTRLCHAARHFQAETIGVRIPKNPMQKRASLSGVQTCGSVWSCPICAKRIATQRGKEISQAIDFMTETGNVAIMVTNTARHNQGAALLPFKTKFKAAHRRFVQSRRWRTLKAEFGIEHSIKAVEGTWGIENGWHYHQHAILFLKADALLDAGEEAFQAWVEAARSLWLKCLELEGLDGIGEIAFDVQADHDVKKNYLAKLGLEDETSKLDYELSAGHNKTSGGAKIWQILEKSWKGDAQYSKLYIEWVEAMSGDNWITFSHGLKDLCGIDELSDEDASLFEGVEEEAANETLLEISDDEFMPVRKLQRIADLLEISATTRSEEAVRKWLDDLFREWDSSHAAQERDKLYQQYLAMNNRWENWRKLINKSGKLPEDMTEFNRLFSEKERLKRRLEL